MKRRRLDAIGIYFPRIESVPRGVTRVREYASIKQGRPVITEQTLPLDHARAQEYAGFLELWVA